MRTYDLTIARCQDLAKVKERDVTRVVLEEITKEEALERRLKPLGQVTSEYAGWAVLTAPRVIRDFYTATNCAIVRKSWKNGVPSVCVEFYAPREATKTKKYK